MHLLAKGDPVMSKRNKDIKMTIFIMVAGIGLIIAGVIGIVTSRIDSREYKSSTDVRKFQLSLLTFQPRTIRMIPVMFVIEHINLRFHMLLTEKPIRENVKSVSGQATTQKICL